MGFVLRKACSVSFDLYWGCVLAWGPKYSGFAAPLCLPSLPPPSLRLLRCPTPSLPADLLLPASLHLSEQVYRRRRPWRSPDPVWLARYVAPGDCEHLRWSLRTVWSQWNHGCFPCAPVHGQVSDCSAALACVTGDNQSRVFPIVLAGKLMPLIC